MSERSILDMELPDIEEQSDTRRGGVSPPELDVTVLERDRDAGGGRVKTGRRRTDLKSIERTNKYKGRLTRNGRIFTITDKTAAF
jgi:hypothetical protein